MQSIKDLIKDRASAVQALSEKHKYISQEFQDYGYRLALKLNDVKRVSMYIKMAKDKPRAHLEQALSFAIDYPNAKSRSGLFLWKMKQLAQLREENLKKKAESEAPKVVDISKKREKGNAVKIVESVKDKAGTKQIV